jgi:putative addiction module CopG family antidote
MMPVHLSENLEHFVRGAVSSGRYASPDDVISDALNRLRETIDSDAVASELRAEPVGPGKKLTKQEFHRHLVKIGLLDRRPETTATADNSPDLIDEEGEVVDEVVIRERLIEWLTGFLEK